MSFVTQFDLTIFAIVLLIALLTMIFVKREFYTASSKLFSAIVIVTILMLLFEILSWIFDGKPGIGNYRLNVLFNVLFTGFNTIVPTLWALYIDRLIFGDDPTRLQKRRAYFIAVVVILSLSIINIFIPILFIINDENIYSRLPLIWISITMTFIIYIYLFGVIIRKRNELANKMIIGVMIFLFLPVVAAVLQLIFYGLLLIWPATAVAIVFSYLIFETTSSNRDFLTGLYTRRRSEEYIKRLMIKNKKFSVIMIDVDDFKVINDTYGHQVGDKSLVELSKILNRVFNEKAVVARIGGDEFLVVSENTNKGSVQYNCKEVQRLLSSSNNDYINSIKFSFGVSVCYDATSCSLEELLTVSDNNMYMNKANNKNLQRRKSDR